MRATINFEADVDRVQQIMWALAFQEMDPLHQAMDFIETAKPHELHEGITNALDLIHRVAQQLEQYRDMLANFERARFETMLPQPAEPASPSTETLLHAVQGAKGTVATMKKFDDFLEKVAQGDPDDSEPEER